MRVINMEGKTYGRLTVLQRVGSKNNRAMWECVCECGKHIITSGHALRRGNTKSCSCLQKDKASMRLKTHGMSSTNLYTTWANIRKRCEDPSSQDYRYYGSRGISVCKEWHDSEVFISWALASGYKQGLTIDRINNNGNYCPENCRWVDRKTQSRNSRKNYLITFRGETHCISEWSEITNIDQNTIRCRIRRYGWDIERALTTPTRKFNRRTA